MIRMTGTALAWVLFILTVVMLALSPAAASPAVVSTAGAQTADSGAMQTVAGVHAALSDKAGTSGIVTLPALEDTLAIKADLGVGYDNSLRNDIVDQAVGSITSGKLGTNATGRFAVEWTPELARSTRAIVGYEAEGTFYGSGSPFNFLRHTARLGAARDLGSVNLAVEGSYSRIDLGGSHLVDGYGGSATAARFFPGGILGIVHYAFDRFDFKTATPDRDSHELGVALVHPFGRNNSFVMLDASASRQRATRNDTYIFWDELTETDYYYDDAYRPDDYRGLKAQVLVRYRPFRKNLRHGFGFDSAWEKRRYSHVSYAIDAVNGARRRDRGVQASGFWQYRLNPLLYSRVTVGWQDMASNLDLARRQGWNALFTLRLRLTR